MEFAVRGCAKIYTAKPSWTECAGFLELPVDNAWQPFFLISDLPAVVGQDSYQRSGRGFYPSRYTGRTLYYLESEYRKDISANGLFGFVVFANLNTVTEPNNHQFAYLHPAAGTGLRIKFNKLTGTNVGFDIGFSKGYTGVYLSLGEAF